MLFNAPGRIYNSRNIYLDLGRGIIRDHCRGLRRGWSCFGLDTLKSNCCSRRNGCRHLGSHPSATLRRNWRAQKPRTYICKRWKIIRTKKYTKQAAYSTLKVIFYLFPKGAKSLLLQWAFDLLSSLVQWVLWQRPLFLFEKSSGESMYARGKCCSPKVHPRSEASNNFFPSQKAHTLVAVDELFFSDKTDRPRCIEK